MKMRQTKIPRYSFVLEKTSGQSVRSNQPLPSVLSTDPDQEGESKQGTLHRKVTITLGTLTGAQTGKQKCGSVAGPAQETEVPPLARLSAVPPSIL